MMPKPKIRNQEMKGVHWSKKEHKKFLEGVKHFGKKNLEAIAKVVGTRDVSQVPLCPSHSLSRPHTTVKCHPSLIWKSDRLCHYFST